MVRSAASVRGRDGPFGTITPGTVPRIGKQPSSGRRASTDMDTEQARAVWFYRDYARFAGGHLKHSHYFDHVRRMPGFTPRITFGAEPSDPLRADERRRLWPAGDGAMAARWEPADRDVVFLAGVDWRYLHRSGLNELPNPRINLVQGVRHANAGTELHRYLGEKAIRICVSQEVADSISATGRPNGPVLTIPNGIDVAPFDSRAGDSPDEHAGRAYAVTIAGYKNPELARALSRHLDGLRIEHRLVAELIERESFLALLARSRIAVCLPREREGFYLPALEAMASGCLVVTQDCMGNRGFCRHEENCLIAGYTPDSLVEATSRALTMRGRERRRMRRRARDTAAEHSLEIERQRFHAILADIDRLWSAANSGAASGSSPSVASDAAPRTPSMPAPPAPCRPRLGFMIVGAQKCGTSALAHFLSQHPEIGMASPKEVHLFDGPGYSARWTPEQIDERYGRRFEHCTGARILGEATPSYMFVPEIAREIARYNPNLKLIVLLRDPVERAISHYYMEKARGRERRPLWLALLREPFRLRRCRNGRVQGSETQRCSYRTRGLYSHQLRNLYRYFDSDQVLIVWSKELRERHDAVLRRVFAFLGVSEHARVTPEIVFRGERGATPHRTVSWLLRLSYVAELARLRALLRVHAPRRQEQCDIS